MQINLQSKNVLSPVRHPERALSLSKCESKDMSLIGAFDSGPNGPPLRMPGLVFIFLFLVLTFTSCLKCTPIIRAQFQKNHKAIQSFLTLEPLLNKYGLYSVEENPDVVFVYNCYDIEKYPQNIPIIILERNAPASLKNKTRHALALNNVKAVFKNKILRPKSNNNKKQILHCYFYHKINKAAQKTLSQFESPLEQELLNKIHHVLWDLPLSAFSQRKFSELRHYKPDFTQERPIDVFFAGAVYQNNHETSIRHALMGWHRSKACETIKNIPGINALVLEGHPLTFEEYLKTMQRSKIVVSPWAWGEWAFRDYETIHCGAILVKPDTSFVESTPDIYQNNIFYVPCKADFSDLETIIQSILQNYDDYILKAQHAKELVDSTWNHEALVARFVHKVREVLAV